MEPTKFKNIFENLSPEEISEANRLNDEEHDRQVNAFKEGYRVDVCYLCNKSFKSMGKDNPCLHWLLRRGKFKKKDFHGVYNKYGYVNVAAFLRWCANQERFQSNINDLNCEKSDRKILSYTIKWKNIEWTFDCTVNDFNGHDGTHVNYPHYHFQMRIDGRQFINFNDFHVPFSDYDLFVLRNSLENGDWFKQDFGAIGSGMQDAVSIPLEDIMDHTTSTYCEEEATYHFSTIIEAKENPISGEEFHDMLKEAKATGKSLTSIMHKRLKERADVKTVISPAESIPTIASRTEHKRR